ncbi:MAG: acyl-CoA synthetase [Planctomycetaceae bacterium]
MTVPSIVDQAIRHADRIAVVTADVSTTYSQLVQRSAAVASALLDGTSDLQEARIAYLVPAGADYVSTQWGVWRAGGVAVPLSASATDRELEYTLTDSQSSVVVTDQTTAGRLQELCDRLKIRLLVLEDVGELQVSLPNVTADRAALMLYTSGTTSKPKGVVTTHRCIQAQIESLVTAWQWQPDDRIPLFLPLHHIHGIINIMSCALWTGATIETFSRFDADSILQRIRTDAYTLFMAVPTIYVRLIELLEAMPASERQETVAAIGRLRLMVSGSAALPASVHESWTQLTRQHLLERYGMTEIGMALANPLDGQRRPGTVGQPLPGVEVRLISESRDVVTDENVPGEIQVRGETVFREYWNRPEATAASFQDGWFCTGDIAVLEDGYYRIMGRSSVDIIKSGGYKLSALEIEASLLDHPSIAACAVVGMPDDTWGEAVSAAIVLKPGNALTLEELRTWCKDRISPYRIPRALRTVDDLPRNAMGKVTKPAVTELFREAGN